jgi:Na+-driven multidrug efflux pump
MLLSIFFLSCTPQSEQFLITIGKQSKLIPISLSVISINICLNYYFIKKGFGISGVAAATSFSSMLSFLISLIYAMRHFSTGRETAVFIFKIIWPLLYTISIIAGCSYFIKISNAYLLLGIKIIIMGIFSLPLVYFINRKSHIFDVIVRSIKEKLRKKNSHSAKNE